MNKKERLSAFNRKIILEAAKQLFLEKGMVQTTMDDIAQKAEYSKSTLYVYFKSKDEIFHHIILEYIEMLRDGVREAVAGAEAFSDGYFALCETLAHFYDTQPFYFESILGEIKIVQDDSDRVLSRIYQVGEEINEIVQNYIEVCAAKKQITTDLKSPLQTAFTLWGSICGIISLANKKEIYIHQSMKVTKEEFMRSGFALLLRSLDTEEVE